MPLIFRRSGMPSFVSNAAYIRQFAAGSWQGLNAYGDPQSLVETVTLSLDVLAGSALVLFATDSNGGSTGPAISVSDTRGNTYSLKKQIDDLLSTGWQSTYTFLAQNTPAGPLTLTATYGNLLWQGLALFEITGVPASCFIDINGNLQTGYTATTTDGITSNTVVGAGAKALLIAHGMALGDQSVANGGSGLGRPDAGTGFTNYAEIWNWQGQENTSLSPSAMVAYRNYASMGTVAATFTGTGGNDDYATTAIALLSN
jgi:hypothetical protein